jgi:hypothetical protein
LGTLCHKQSAVTSVKALREDAQALASDFLPKSPTAALLSISILFDASVVTSKIFFQTIFRVKNSECNRFN